MNKIIFSHDYQKLPVVWQGTQAVLIAVYPEKIKSLQDRFPAFVKHDIAFRGEKGNYVFDFEEALVLIFIHYNTGQLFSTIRINYPQKYDYYVKAIGQTFELKKAIE